jgi:hypothetical protein
VRSIKILDPLLTSEMREHPAWASWCKLVQIWTLVVQHSLDASDVARLDALQLEYSALFDAVPEYNGLKRPKHHLLTHLPLDVWRYGPPRGYWCFGFEHFNSVLKAGARRCQWKNEVVSVMRYWSLWSARRVASSMHRSY